MPEARSASSAVLEVEGVHTYYGESHVLQGISLRVGEGEVLTILGRNGAGKTTLVRSIIGFTPPREGHVRFKGRDITEWPPYRMVGAGMAVVPQGRRVFPSLTVQENLEVARGGHGRWTVERVHTLFPRLRERAGNRANKLSGGEQQMLAIGRALMTNPELIREWAAAYLDGISIKIINEQSNVNMTEVARSKIETFPIRRRKILEQFDLVAAGCF